MRKTILFAMLSTLALGYNSSSAQPVDPYAEDRVKLEQLEKEIRDRYNEDELRIKQRYAAFVKEDERRLKEFTDGNRKDWGFRYWIPEPKRVPPKPVPPKVDTRRSRLEEYIHKERLSKTEFQELAEMRLTFQEYAFLISSRGIRYTSDCSNDDLELFTPPPNSHCFRDIKKSYGPALDTFNLKEGVCDELANLALILCNSPEVKSCYLIEVVSQDRNVGSHAFALFQTSRNTWRSINNTEVFSTEYSTAQEAVSEVIKYNYNLSNLDGFKAYWREIKHPESAFYSASKSAGLRPNKKFKLRKK